MIRTFMIFPFILLSLLLAIWTGWLRIGWSFPITSVAAEHGALMVNSFLASLIYLERAVAVPRKWVLLLPFVNALSIVAFLFHLPAVARLLFTAGSGVFIIMSVHFVFRFKESYYYIFLVGASCLLVGNIILYKTGDYRACVTWWIGFLLLTIVAERLELSRFLSLSRKQISILWTSIGIVVVGLLLPYRYGTISLALGLALIAGWLLKYDMARRSVKVKGQHRYSGLLLIVGYVWLLIMSVLLLFEGMIPFGYDAVLHSFFIGFIFSMIFSHAVIILPAVTRQTVKLFRPILYVWFVLLQASLIVRIAADLFADITWRKMGGLVNGVSILLFFFSIAVIMLAEVRKRRQVPRELKEQMRLA